WWRDMVLCPPLGPDGQPLAIVGVDTAVIQSPRTWEASGHVAGFNDPMVDCRGTKKRYRADHLLCAQDCALRGGDRRSRGCVAVLSDDNAEAAWEKHAAKLARRSGGGEVLPPGAFTLYNSLSPAVQHAVVGPDTDTPGTLTEPRMFNLMFETYV